jgi:glycosyltransferase involved in cell wall biosynthesis
LSATRPVILVLMGAFWPGSDSAGPNQSLKGFCTALAEDFDFRIIARDRPFGAPARTAPTELWTDLGFARISYLQGRRFGAAGLRALLRQTPHDLLMMNGFFDREFTLPTLLMRRAGLVPGRPALLSPRGEFGGGALSLKAPVKRAWLAAVRMGGLLKDVALHATSQDEAVDIAARLPFAPAPVVAPNVRALFERPPTVPVGKGEPLRLAFLGRITPVKNIDYAIKALAMARSPARLDLYGPASDEAYTRACQILAASLPAHLEVRFMGEIANADAPAVMAGYDLMFMPTLGENFGHAIFEALGAGTPVLISDRTPWRGLEARRAGFDLSLDDPAAFANTIDRVAAQSPAVRALWRDAARAEAERASLHSDAITRSHAMLDAALARGRR